MAMHWGEEYLSGVAANGERLAGVNALTTSAYCPSSKQPELKHAAVKILKAEMPWSLLAMAWLPDGEALAARGTLKTLMSAFPFTSCVPFSNRTPLNGLVPERSGVLFRAASHEPPTAETLALIEQALGLAGNDTLRYADAKKGQHRTARLVRHGGQVALDGFLLAGDTSAEAWIKSLLQDELPAQAYGRLLLLPGAKAPAAVQARGKPVCTCWSVSDTAIADELARVHEQAGGAADLMNDTQRLAALQATLQCGTQCGSCLPELKRLVRAYRPTPAGRVIPIHAAA